MIVTWSVTRVGILDAVSHPVASAPTLDGETHVYAASARAMDRRTRAVAYLRALGPRQPVVVVAPEREIATELLREALGNGMAAFGWRALGFAQLVVSLAQAGLARAGVAPAGGLVVEAVAARTAFERGRQESSGYFAPVLPLPGFPRALAATVTELRMARVGAEALSVRGAPAADVGVLLEDYEAQLASAGLADRARIFELAEAAVLAGPPETAYLNSPLVLLDVAFHAEREADVLAALVSRCSHLLATVPAGDRRTLAVMAKCGVVPSSTHAGADLSVAGADAPAVRRLQAALFEEGAPELAEIDDSIEVFSAPGEGREAVEIARRVLAEAERGVPFDQIAILVRSPDAYWGLLDHALRRARIPAYYSRGTRRPDPSGRALLALLACAAEQLSARRFAEYLSLGQVPRLSESGVPAPTEPAWHPSADEFLTPLPPAARRVQPTQQRLLFDDAPTNEAFGVDETGSDGEVRSELSVDEARQALHAPALRGTLRAPRRWETLLAESGVIHGAERWARRLDGLAREYEVRLREVRREEPGDGVEASPRVASIQRDIEHLEHLRRFAIPVVEALAALPARASWGEWIAAIEALAPRVLSHPDRVLSVVADLRPMARVGPVSLDEVRSVLTDRLTTTEAEPPINRYGRVFVGTPDHSRGRVFRVVFVPGLAERLFPQRPRQDPLLLDEWREGLGGWLRRQEDRAADERVLLRLAVGSASERVVVSYPRLEVQQSRARVPSFYALDVLRAATGRVPDHEEVGREAARQGDAWLAWPAPVHARDAIDDGEFDLATLRDLLRPGGSAVDAVTRKGRARYLLELNAALDRSVRARWARWRPKWSGVDGLVRPGESVQTALAPHRPSARAYSVSALQRFAQCPYQFLLGAVYRLAPFEEPEPLERLDPLTKGALFHELQRDVLRALQGAGHLPLTAAAVPAALLIVDEQLVRVSAAYHEALAPAIQRVWDDEIELIRADMRTWVRMLAETGALWVPAHFEFSFGLPLDGQHDRRSVADPVSLDGRFRLRGAIDLIERRADGALRVTDHKTGRKRARPGMVIGGGEMLQPVVYSLAVEGALQAPVVESRLWYCTSVGEFAVHPVRLDDAARRDGLEVFEIIDRAVEHGNLPPAPKDPATCVWCDFRPVCGGHEHERSRQKANDADVVGDLSVLRRKP